MSRREPSADDAILLDDRIAYQCLLIASRITQFMAPMWEQQFGLTVITWRVLAVIGRFGPLSARQLADHTSTDAFFVSRAIEQLVKQGFVSRRADPEDRRRLLIKLTSKGIATRNRVEKALSKVEQDILSRVRAGDRQRVRGVLAELNSATQFLADESISWEDYAG